MRLLAEIIIIGALIYFGWEKPFRDWLPSNITSATEPTEPQAAATAPAPRPQPFARSTSTPSGSWMWDPSHHSALDPLHRSPTPH
jgi:hypothetical protein